MEQFVTIDSAGRLVIPRDVRVRLQLRGGMRLRLRTDGERVVLEREVEQDAVVEEEGLLLASGRIVGDWIDHRDVRADRLESLTQVSE